MVCTGPCSLQALIFTLHADKHGSNLADGSGGAVNETPVSVSLPPGLAHRQTHNALLWNGYLCLDTSVFDSTRAMF